LGSTDDHATVVGRVAQNNEWSLTHEILCIYFAANLARRAAKGAVAARAAVLLQTPLAGSDHAAIADALSTLESKLSGLISLSADERRSLNKMGEKSETFCRRTLVAMSENPGLIPADVDVAEVGGPCAQGSALGPQMVKVQGSSALRPGFKGRAARTGSPVECHLAANP
jgi:hypothetical protein